MASVTTDIAAAARALAGGRLVAFATETVYGLGADATNAQAVAGIFDAKQRPQFNPLIVHVPEIGAAMELGVFNDAARRLAERFWPGPLTLAVERRAGCRVSTLVSAGLSTIAVRVPSHRQARQLLQQAGCPVAAPSANVSGQISPTRPEHVVESLGDRIWGVLDGGPCDIGLESTVVGCTGETPVLLRPGGVTAEAIETALGRPLEDAGPAGDTPLAPGQLASHYAPRARLRMNATAARAGEAYLGFGAVQDGDLNLSASGDLTQAAANLFDMLHRLDATGADTIAVAPVPQTGLGVAINDRLTRAAAPRENIRGKAS